MTRRIVFAVICLAALGACERAKPRHLPPDPMAITPPPAVVAAPSEGMSAGLPRLGGLPALSFDRIGAAPDPLNVKPAVTPGDQPIVVSGFAFDFAAKAPGQGVDLVVDGKAYGTAYGADRPDVAVYFKQPTLRAVGYSVTLPAHALAPGRHSIQLRVISVDGKGFYESPNYEFTVK